MAGFLGGGLRAAVRHLPPAALKPFGRPAALFFHGVARTIRDPRIQINQHDEAEFRRIARQLKDNFDVLPLNALNDVLRAPERHSRALFLMSDDGYANTLSIAADILEEMQLPWTLFVSSHHIDTGEWNPMTVARLFFFYAPEGRYTLGDMALALGRDREAQAARVLHALRNRPAGEVKPAIAAMHAVLIDAQLGDLFDEFDSERFLNWDEVRVLLKRGVEIGAHAHYHWPMNAAQNPDGLREQARAPRKTIAQKLDYCCSYFAYPFGNTGDIARDARRAVRAAGYKAAFTTLSGTLDAKQDKLLLPRYGIARDEANLAATVPALRAGNFRLRNWQRALVS